MTQDPLSERTAIRYVLLPSTLKMVFFTNFFTHSLKGMMIELLEVLKTLAIT